MSAGVTSGRSSWPAQLLDAALDEPVLVIGSAPPLGNDLDLLVRAAQEHFVAEILSHAGFACQTVAPFRGYPRGFRIWAAFRRCDSHAVDEIPVGNFELTPAEVERLFAEARPLPGFTRLLRPSPRHVLLILAHNSLDREERPRPLSASRRRRVRQALEEEPAAWELAGELAPAWHSAERLPRLRAAFELPEAAAGSVAADGRSPLRRAREYRRAWNNGRLIALSGPDDAARGEQAEGLERAFEGLDIPARLVRTDLDGSALLRVARELRRAVLPGLLAGEVVICDRYVLDAAVSLRARHRRRRQIRWYVALLRLLVPAPGRAYLIDSPGRQAGLFAEHCGALGVRRLDGARPPEDLCAEIGLDAWQAVR